MLLKIIFIISILCKFNLLCYGIHISTYNETNLILSMNSQLSELRAEQERHVKLIDGLVKAMDIQDRQESDIQLVRAELSSLRAEQTGIKSNRDELDRLGTLINGLVKESDIQLVREDISSLRAEQERLGKAEDNKEKSIKSNRDELDRLGNIINEHVKKSDAQLLKTDIQSIKEDLGRKRLEHVKDLEKLYLRSNPRNCTQAKTSGIHEILLSNFSSQPFKVSCDLKTRGGGWTVILRRMDGSVDFNRNWTEYKEGFGDLNGEFILGLDKIHALTAERDHELLVLLEDKDGIEAFETYDEFAIGNEEEQYELHTLGKANGTAGDALEYHRGIKFSTLDRDNDRMENESCAKDYTGGWWYNRCHYSHLTGTYNNNNWGMGVNWFHFRNHKHSLKRATMMIRPKK